MNFKNSFLVCFNNFMLVWKQFLFTLIVLLIVSFATYELLVPIINLLKINGWVSELQQLFNLAITSSNGFWVELKSLFDSLWIIVFSNFSSIWGSSIGLAILLLLVPTVCYSISYYTITDVLNGKLSFWAKYGYLRKMVSNLKNSILYSIFVCIYSIPFTALMFLVFYLYGFFANSLIAGILTVPVIILLVIGILALRKCFIVWFAPKLVQEDVKVSTAFVNAFIEGGKNFGKNFLQIGLMYLIEFFAVIVIGLFTLGAGLIVVIPAMPVLNSAFALVSYFSKNKQRYYMGENIIINPL